MGKKEEKVLENWLVYKKNMLKDLQDQHRIDIEVFNARRQMLLTDISDLEKQLNGDVK